MSGPVARIVEVVVPARLGRGFRWLYAASIATNIGDGIVLSAGPLLVAAQTRDPLLVSLAVLSQYLPHLLFGLLAGVVADRHDRRRIVTAVNLGRAAVVLGLTVAIATSVVNIAILLLVLFVLGTAETFADAASSTLLPRLVEDRDLGAANTRTQGATLLLNQLAAPPVGAFLFAVGMALPFAVNAAGFALGAVLISRVVVSSTLLTADERRGIRTEIGDGVRWLMRHPPMRTLAITIFTFNITFGAAWSVLVLYAAERLAMDALGFGLLTTAMAVGGIIGVATYGRLERRFALGDIMRVGLLIETLTHLVFAVNTAPSIALATMVLMGAHAFVWGTTSNVVRQRAVPDELMGRVGSVYRIAGLGGHVVGAPIGGLLARGFGITAPFWFGFIGSALLVVLLWRQFAYIAHAGDPSSAAAAGD
ncbi:MAG TPA: MFS transporter [Candidatus Limnocylindrales bacterium]|nr:MFS transporter [Candidatus Limnocylindrales bacterium]